MPAPHPNLCGYLPTIMCCRGITPCVPAPHPILYWYLRFMICCQQRYQTLHASPPSYFVWVPSNHHVLPAEVSDLACQQPILICVGTFQPSCAASRSIRPCMATPPPNLCGYLASIMCRQQRYHTLHASPPSKFVWVPSNHHWLPATVSDLACQPPILFCVGTFQPSCAASRSIRPCMPAPHPNLCGYLPTIMFCQQKYQTLHAIPPS